MAVVLVERELGRGMQFSRLWVVWIDTNMGFGRPDWCENSDPQTLAAAAIEAAQLRAAGWPVKVLPAE